MQGKRGRYADRHGPKQLILNTAKTVDLITVTTPCRKKTVQICFCYNFVKFPPIWIIFDRKMAKRLKLYQMDSFPISPNSRHHTTVLNADVQNCYITLKVVICNNLSDNLMQCRPIIRSMTTSRKQQQRCKCNK